MDSTQSSPSRTRMDSIRGFPSAETDASKMGEFLTALGDIQSIDIDKLKARLFQTEKPVSQNIGNDLIIESNRILESQKKETELVRKQLEEEQKFSKEYVNVFGETKINDLMKMMEDMDSAIEKLEKETQRLKEKNIHLEEEKQKALEEKSNALARLSKQISDQMTDSNPNIADLSDKSRSNKLGERYSEMYDNQWTNVFEALTETYRQNDEVAIQILIKVLIECYNFAKRRAEMQIDELVRAVTGGSSVQVVNEMKLHLRKARNLVDIPRADLLPDCESYVKRRVTSARSYLQVDKEMKEYLKECFQICWLMAIQDLPVVLGHEAKHLEDFNMMLYKPFKRSGTKVDFVVLPPLLLHEGGPLLAKGVAQPILEKRKEDLRSVKQNRRTAWVEGDKTKHLERFTQTIMKQDDVDHRLQASRIKTEDIPIGRKDERKHQLTTKDTVPTNSSPLTLANPLNILVSKAGNTQSVINLSRGTDTGYHMQPVKTFYNQTSAA